MQTYKFIKTSTAGNRTGFILGKKSWQNRKKIIKILTNKKNLEAEQYAFLWQTPKNEPFMIMAGGEISGGAILASAMILKKFTGCTTINIPQYRLKTLISNRWQNKIFIQTELPDSIIDIPPQPVKIIYKKINYQGYKVVVDGIAYFVTKNIIKDKSREFFKNLDCQLATDKIPCIGAIEILKSAKMKPTVWIKTVGTITEEQGCTTGTISSQLSFPNSNGCWQQPSKEYIKAVIKNKKIIISSSVELLAEGKIYLNGN